MSNIELFAAKKVRTHWDEESEQWYFSVIDVVEALTDSTNPRDYWFKMKTRVKTEDGLELSRICRQFIQLTTILIGLLELTIEIDKKGYQIEYHQ